MKLLELKILVDGALETPGNENLDVVIGLDQPSVGVEAFAEIANAYPGFDWESGQFRLSANKSIVEKK